MNRLDELGRRLAAEQDRMLDTREDIMPSAAAVGRGVATRTGLAGGPRWATTPWRPDWRPRSRPGSCSRIRPFGPPHRRKARKTGDRGVDHRAG